MIGCILKHATRTPLNNPNTNATTRAASTAMPVSVPKSGVFPVSTKPLVTADIAMTDPTEISIPPVEITSTIPNEVSIVGST